MRLQSAFVDGKLPGLQHVASDTAQQHQCSISNATKRQLDTRRASLVSACESIVCASTCGIASAVSVGWQRAHSWQQLECQVQDRACHTLAQSSERTKERAALTKAVVLAQQGVCMHELYSMQELHTQAILARV